MLKFYISANRADGGFAVLTLILLPTWVKRRYA
jgi:hypothetical protein